MHDQYVALGLARVRSAWFRDLSRWATAGQLPLDFVKCVSVDEVRARLGTGRAFSALFVDAGLPALDRDLVDAARQQGCAVVAVDDGHRRLDWADLGVAAVLSEPLEPRHVLAALVEHATAVTPLGEELTGVGPDDPTPWQGRLVAVTGAGGSGTSTVAMALAQGLAADPRHGGRVLLADLALHADQAMLHDVGDVVPGVQELVEAHRSGRPDPGEVRSLVFACPDRGYDLLLGLRRHRDWAALRPRAFEAGLDALTRNWSVTVADVDPDLEGEDDCGSVDVEERNLMARTVLTRAEVVVVTARAGASGLHRLARLLDGVLHHGVPGTRVLPVLVWAPRSPRARAEMTRALAALTAPLGEAASSLCNPVFVPERRQLEAAVRGADPLPRALSLPLAQAVAAVADRAGQRRPEAPVPVAPGSLGYSAGA